MWHFNFHQILLNYRLPLGKHDWASPPQSKANLFTFNLYLSILRQESLAVSLITGTTTQHPLVWLRRCGAQQLQSSNDSFHSKITKWGCSGGGVTLGRQSHTDTSAPASSPRQEWGEAGEVFTGDNFYMFSSHERKIVNGQRRAQHERSDTGLAGSIHTSPTMCITNNTYLHFIF